MSSERILSGQENDAAPQQQQQQQQQLSYFEKTRDLLISDITNSIESVLNEMNALNRSLENSIAVGKEFDSVSSLWETFYTQNNTELEQLAKNINNNTQQK